MRIFYIICTVIASASNIALILLFIKKLRVHLVGKAWICIFMAFCLLLYNNLLISYLVISRPRGWFIVYFLISFFVVKVVKNLLWLTGFWAQYKEFCNLENLDKYIPVTKKSPDKEIFSKELVEDLKHEDKSSRNKSD